MILPKQWVSKRIMTKADVEEIVKRYPFVIEAIKTGREKAIFYIGNRKRCIEISEDVKAVCAIFDDIQSRSLLPLFIPSIMQSTSLSVSQCGATGGSPWRCVRCFCWRRSQYRCRLAVIYKKRLSVEGQPFLFATLSCFPFCMGPHQGGILLSRPLFFARRFGCFRQPGMEFFQHAVKGWHTVEPVVERGGGNAAIV